MRGGRTIAIGCVAVAAVLGYTCGPQRVATPSPPGSALFVLLPDVDSGALGSASVSSASVTVDLAGARDATRVVANQSPTPPVTLDEAGPASSGTRCQPCRRQDVFNLNFRFESDELTVEGKGTHFDPAVVDAFIRGAPFLRTITSQVTL